MYRFIRYAQPLVTNAAAYRSRWSDLEQEINSLFANPTANESRSIPVGLHADKENFYVTAELPGVHRDDINVEIVDGVLSLKATRKLQSAEGEQTVSLARDLNLEDPVQADKISAELKDGLLKLTLPKVEAVKPRKIEIK